MNKPANAIELLIDANAVERLQDGDASLFSADRAQQDGIEERLGWLTLASDAYDYFEYLTELREEAHARGLTDIVLIGMGGSSLSVRMFDAIVAPEEDDSDLSDNAGTEPNQDDTFHAPTLHVLDTTHPRDVAALLTQLAPTTTLVIVSSKSGSTTEPRALGDLFFNHFCEVLGSEEAPHHFVAITDEGSPLDQSALDAHWDRIIHARATVGGRFSALSMFGLVPAAYAGIDFERLIENALPIENLCRGEETFANPGAQLACFLFDAYQNGRDKLFFIVAPRYRAFGLWLEQLIAESLGKDGRGIIPLVTEQSRVGNTLPADACAIIMRDADDEFLERYGEELEASGPVTEFTLNSPHDIAGECVRWEYATALLGFLMGLNPFDQPDVAASKAQTVALLEGAPYEGTPHDSRSLPQLIHEGDYLALLSYLPNAEADMDRLLDCARSLEERYMRPVLVAQGPRYLHSTGQLFKGGPNRGVFLMVGNTAPGADDITLVNRPYTLAQLIDAQRKGDMMSLLARGRRVVTAQSLEDL